MLKKNDEFELMITAQGSLGEGIGHFEGMAFFVKGAVTGDRILAGVTKLKKTYGYARLIKILEPSPDRVPAPCPLAARCGGCQLQNLSYEAQLRYKENKVREDLIRIGGISADRVCFHHIAGMASPVRYRNKGQFPVGTDRDGKIISGFYAGHTHSIIDTDSCMIEHELTDGIMRAVREYMTEEHISAYEEPVPTMSAEEYRGKTCREVGRRGNVHCSAGSVEDSVRSGGTGLVRHVLTRIGYTTHEVMVCVVINGRKLPRWELLRGKLETKIDEFNRADAYGCGEGAGAGAEAASGPKYILKSLSYDINTEDTNVIMGPEVVTLYGDGFICDYIGDVKYRISPLSFYQVNPVQTRVLYSTALEYAGLTGNEVVWDLYCGIGTISLFLAKKAKKVYGVEIVPQAIEDARVNAELNGITNAEFFVGAAEEVLPAAYAQDPSMHADVIVVDPPRKGCDEALLTCMAELAPSRIVYVSCDPATLARDVKILEAKGYGLKEVRPVDMFAYSGHVETVVLMSKAK